MEYMGYGLLLPNPVEDITSSSPTRLYQAVQNITKNNSKNWNILFLRNFLTFTALNMAMAIGCQKIILKIRKPVEVLS
jgi:hypothetical protein